jgi:hypothetical protein
MLYRELVQFEPIDTVVQLQEAGEEGRAWHLVETYVISDRMADQLAEVVIPQLQFQKPHDNKGVLIVGNYGTGKSHLMSVISAVAEYPGMAGALTHDQVRTAAAAIEGRFKVARVELGSVQGSLRDILVREVEIAFAEWGTPYSFAAADQLTNNKDALVEAVGVFQARYPDEGILLVVDELLDFLRARDERSLILDLGFLRELGEVARLTPFRFMGGLQETLFDSPRFTFVAEQLRRVRDRFEQVSIARQDIAFVVANRLLRKSDEQLARITEHLRPFTPLYAQMAERMEECARLFPIHPAYIDTFQDVYVAEKREVLKTFSQTMTGLLDQEVPNERPGLVSYDAYWQVLRDNPSMRTYPEVAEVLEKSGVLEGQIEHRYTRPPLKEMAQRIVHALAVQRLTTSDITTPLGVTPEELRDDLCLYVKMPEQTADFLADQVRVALREIIRTVAGQYVSYNEANDQYYLDVKKDIDFDTIIRDRGESLDRQALDGYFFDALRQVLDLGNTQTYVPGHRIWEWQLTWAERRVNRPGYLFFGAPDERSTAQPPRDFYAYVLPPFLDRPLASETHDDEVIFRLVNLDARFTELLRLYAGARAMEGQSSAHRAVYAGKAEEHGRRLVRWLNEYLAEHLEVTYQGQATPARERLARARSTAGQGIEDLLKTIASTLLAPHFAECYPDYPAFNRLSQPISEEARANAAADAIRFIAREQRTNLAAAVLDGLKLLGDGEVIRADASPYAKRFLKLFDGKSDGQVVNRGELVVRVAGGIKPIEKDPFFGLEPEWVAVVLVALVYAGEIALTLDAKETLDAGNVASAAMVSIDRLMGFQHFARPKQVPVRVWEAIFEGLGLQPARVRDEGTRREAVADLLSAVAREQGRVAAMQAGLQGLKLWNEPVFTDHFTLKGERGAIVGTDLPAVPLTTTDLQVGLRGYKAYLEELAKYNTVGKLRNLRFDLGQVTEAREHRKTVERAEGLQRLVAQLQPVTTYLATAQANLPVEHAWSQRAEATRRALLDDVRRIGKGEAVERAGSLQRELEALKKEYVAIYSAMHREATLGPQADDRRQRLANDPRLKALNALASIDLLSKNKGVLDGWKMVIAGIPACRSFHTGIIEDKPTCPECHFRPSQRSPQAEQAEVTLSRLDVRLGQMLTSWRQALDNGLQSDEAKLSLQNMTASERGPIDAFLAQPDDEAAISPRFVEAATQALRGIHALALSEDDLLAALREGGLPCTAEEFKSRFREFVDKAMRGHDPRNTRITLDGRQGAEVIELRTFAERERA